MTHSTNQGLGRQSALTRRSFVAGASVLAAGMLLGGPFGCSAPAEEGAADTSIEAEAQATGKAADLVFKNGHVQTLVNEGDVAQAVAVRGGDIVYVGDDAGIEAFVGDATKVIDLGGKFLCPGFMDGHLHGPQPYYEELFQIAIPEGTMDNEEYLRIIREFVEAHPDDEVYYGGPFMHNAAGQPSGLLTDAAKGLVTSKIEVPYSTENMAKAYEAFQEYCHSLGITGLTNINLSGIELIHAEALHNMDARGDLHLRQRFLVWGQPGMGYEGIKKKLDAVAAYDSDMFQTGTVKIVYDGVTEGATAVMLEPYLPAAGKGEGWTATSDWSTEELDQVVADLDKNGYQAHIHAIGDGAVRASLDAYERAEAANGKRDARHTMVHVCAITPEDIKRCADLKAISNLQFLWMYNDPLCQLEAAFIGKERAFAMYPAKDMLEAGCLISGGSDGAVTAYDPLLEIEVGITRNSPFPVEEDEDHYRWKEQGLQRLRPSPNPA